MRTDKGWRALQAEKERNELTFGKILEEVAGALLIAAGGTALCIALFLY